MTIRSLTAALAFALSAFDARNPDAGQIGIDLAAMVARGEQDRAKFRSVVLPDDLAEALRAVAATLGAPQGDVVRAVAVRSAERYLDASPHAAKRTYPARTISPEPRLAAELDSLAALIARTRDPSSSPETRFAVSQALRRRLEGLEPVPIPVTLPAEARETIWLGAGFACVDPTTIYAELLRRAAPGRHSPAALAAREARAAPIEAATPAIIPSVVDAALAAIRDFTGEPGDAEQWPDL